MLLHPNRHPSPSGAWHRCSSAPRLVLIAALGAWWLLRPADKSSPARHAAHSIAVLPFVDMSQTKDQAYLADGLSEEILNRLAQSRDLRVIARTSSFALRDPALDVAEIARRLQVTHVLEGSVRKSGDTVRVTAQLIAASDSSHVWSETFDRRIQDLLAVQDEIAGAVAYGTADHAFRRLRDSTGTRKPRGLREVPAGGVLLLPTRARRH